MNCNRCGKETTVHIMSMFNAEEICMDCKAAEEMRPDYKDAVATDEKAFLFRARIVPAAPNCTISFGSSRFSLENASLHNVCGIDWPLRPA